MAIDEIIAELYQDAPERIILLDEEGEYEL